MCIVTLHTTWSIMIPPYKSLYFNADSYEKRNDGFIKQQHTMAHQQTKNTNSNWKQISPSTNKQTNKETNKDAATALILTKRVAALQFHLHLDLRPTQRIFGCMLKQVGCDVDCPQHRNVPTILRSSTATWPCKDFQFQH